MSRAGDDSGSAVGPGLEEGQKEPGGILELPLRLSPKCVLPALWYCEGIDWTHCVIVVVVFIRAALS